MRANNNKYYNSINESRGDIIIQTPSIILTQYWYKYNNLNLKKDLLELIGFKNTLYEKKNRVYMGDYYRGYFYRVMAKVLKIVASVSPLCNNSLFKIEKRTKLFINRSALRKSIFNIDELCAIFTSVTFEKYFQTRSVNQMLKTWSC